MIAVICIGLIGLLCFYGEFFVPGGILAILGILLVLGSSIAFFCKTDSSMFGLLYVLFLLGSSFWICFFAMKKIRKSGKNNSFFLEKDQEGFTAADLPPDLIGKKGTVRTELKPSGHVMIEGKIYQAMSEGGFLPKGTEITVASVRGSHLVVVVTKEGV